MRRSSRLVMLVAMLLFIALSTAAQEVKEPSPTNPEWSKPYQPFRIAGNLYYVGSYELASYLVTTTKGNILINTGLAASTAMIKANIESLGFVFADTKILLTTQAHFDHVGAMAEVKRLTGAQLMVDEKDADVLADGGKSDYALSHLGVSFAPVKADRLLHDGDTIALGDTRLVMLHHPGHTKGSCSFLLTVKDNQRSYKVLIANMPTIVTEEKLSAVKTYPDVIKDFSYTFRAMRNVSFDLWVASHAGQFKLHEKHSPGDAYNPDAFMDQDGYKKALDDLQKQFEEKL